MSGLRSWFFARFLISCCVPMTLWKMGVFGFVLERCCYMAIKLEVLFYSRPQRLLQLHTSTECYHGNRLPCSLCCPSMNSFNESGTSFSFFFFFFFKLAKAQLPYSTCCFLERSSFSFIMGQCFHPSEQLQYTALFVWLHSLHLLSLTYCLCKFLFRVLIEQAARWRGG